MPLRLYRYAGRTIATRMPLPELPLSFGKPNVRFQLQRRLAGRPGRCVRTWETADGRVFASLHRARGAFEIHFKRMARFRVSQDLSIVRCAPCASLSAATIRHLFLDQVMPIVLSLAGDDVLHASAVETGGNAVAFVGESGAGKSTVAAALGRAGCRILSDDCLVIRRRGDGCHASAPYRSLRLWEDSAAALKLGRGEPGHRAGKRRFSAAERLSFTGGPLPLGAVCVLHRTDSTACATLARLPASEAVVTLLKSRFRFDVEERSVLEREFRFLSHLVATVPCFRVTFPDSLDELPSLHQIIIDTVRLGRPRRIA